MCAYIYLQSCHSVFPGGWIKILQNISPFLLPFLKEKACRCRVFFLLLSNNTQNHDSSEDNALFSHQCMYSCTATKVSCLWNYSIMTGGDFCIEFMLIKNWRNGITIQGWGETLTCSELRMTHSYGTNISLRPGDFSFIELWRLGALVLQRNNLIF